MYLSIITLNVNGLNAPIKRHRVAEWTRQQYPYTRCLQETYLRSKDTYRLKVKGQKKIFHAIEEETKARLAVLISDKIDFESKAIVRDKKGRYIMIKGTIQQQDITIVDIYTSNKGAYVKQCCWT